jgi:chemotaxis signal transduction protein
VLVALLGDAPLAIAAEVVAAVVRPGAVTPVAGTEPWLAGVTAVRGRVLPVADLRRLAGLPAGDDVGASEVGAPADAWHVVLDDGRRAAALAGLRVRRVVACAPADDGDAAPAARSGEPAAAAPAPALPVRGVVRLERDNVRGADALPPAAPLLDAAALLDLVHDPPTDGG